MHQIIQFLLNHGIAVLFVAVLTEQAGLPVPGAPVLLAVGSLASLGRMNLTSSIGMALLACLVADYAWYEIGHRRRSKLLYQRARRPIGSNDHIGSIMAAMSQYGLGALLLAKFLPGPNLVTPLVGLSGLARSRFLFFDGIASVVWVGGYITAGYIFSNQLETITANGSRFGWLLLVVLTCLFAAFAAVRSLRRRWPQWHRQVPQVSA
ncbi:MAG: DedA family protein [Acidobacteriaceae bacterium]